MRVQPSQRPQLERIAGGQRPPVVAAGLRGLLAPGYYSPRAPRSPSRAPRAFTLIELLVTVTIMLILVAGAVTMFRQPLEERRIREAARAINVYLGSARNRAMESGRPCGVTFRSFGAPGFAMNADQCEVPPCYAGDTEQSVATLQMVVYTLSNGTTPTLLTANLANTTLTGMVRPGDLVQFNYQGPVFTVAPTDTGATPQAINPVNGDGYLTGMPVVLAIAAGQNSTVPWNGQSVPFRIYRAPTKSFAQSLHLPAASVVDLQSSGSGTATVGNANFTILFSPNGAVDCVYVNAVRSSVTEPIYLLVGKREKIDNAFVAGNTNEATLTNWQDLNNLWMVINPQTGLISTGEVSAPLTWNAASSYLAEDMVYYSGNSKFYRCLVSNSNKQPDTNSTYWSEVSGPVAARALARDMQGKGGR